MTKSDLSRRMGYPRVKLHDDAACVEYEIAKRAYLAHIPQDRFSIRDIFPVPHHGDTIMHGYFVVAETAGESG